MVFNSVPFFVLVMASYITLHFTKTAEKKKLLLLASSYVFYAYWDFRFLFLMIFAETVSYFGALKIQKDRRRSHLVISISILLGILLGFKYLGFFSQGVAALMGNDSLIIRNVVLPIGISFYTFQCISYLADVWRGEIQAKDSFTDLALFISFFPQLVAGPIMRAKDFLPQLDAWSGKLSKDDLCKGMQIFLMGLFKKVVIADRLAVCVDAVFDAPKAYSGVSILFASVSYAIQILCDFSGYSDMAIGTAKIFGFDLCRNFNLPYLASNPAEFWRRWHISLSQWLRDYLYIPMGGNRKGKTRTYTNLMITMLLGGLWHGASLNFLAWGAIHGVALVIHRLYSKSNLRSFFVKNGANRVYTIVCVIINNIFVVFSWVVFRLKTLEEIKTVFVRMITMADGIQYVYTYSLVFIVMIIVYYLYAHIRHKDESWYVTLDLTRFWSLVLIFLVIWMILLFGYSGNNAFIYFQF